MSQQTTSPPAASAATTTSSHSSSPTPSGLRRILSRLGVRGRLFAMAITLIGLGAVCVVVATSGLIGQKGKVHQVDTTFKTFQADRDAYEGWLTADDQMNMYAALAVLKDPSQRQLANVTWNQVVQGHAQAITSLRWLIAHASDPAVRNSAQSTLTDLDQYYGFTLRMHAAVLKGNPRLAVRLVTVNNAPASNKTQADFDAMGKALTAAAARITAQANSAATSSEQLVIIVALITIVLSVLITLYLARSITRPLGEITAAAEKIAEGDLNVSVRADTDDEIGRLATAFSNSVDYLGEMAGAADRIADGDLAVTVTPRSPRDVLGQAFARMRDKLAGTIENIARSSESVGAASTEMAQSSQQAGMAVGEIANAVGSVAAGAETQVRSLEQAREVTAQVAAASEASAADADETATAARQARAVAEEGAAAVRRASEAMQAVHASSTEITERMRDLGAMSEQIGGIVDTTSMALLVPAWILVMRSAMEPAAV